MNLYKRLFIAAALLSGCAALHAKVEMPSFFSDNMVLQQNTKVALWGTATGKKVTVTASWTKETTVSVPDAEGKWSVNLETPAAGGPYEICLNDGENKFIRNVMIGEVWFCCGQSNMQMPMRGWKGQPIEHSTEFIMTARPDVPVRVIDIKTCKSVKPVFQTEGTWKEHTPENVYESSATAYFFARRLHEILQVPVGIITSYWGGSSIEAWMSREILEKDFAEEFNTAQLDTTDIEKLNQRSPAVLYNGMLAPLFPFTIKGVLWYQGEANRGRHQQYEKLQPRFVQMLRDEFMNPEAPFYFVQIAPYKYGDPEGFKSGYFYEAQQNTLALIPHSGMAPTVDLGDYNFIHPPKKKEVGERLAMLALVNDYGLKGVNPVAPTYESVEFKDGKAVVHITTDKEVGLIPAKVSVGGFEIAGADRIFHPAVAEAYENNIIVSSPEVSEPVAVRYCFRNWGEGSLFNSSGIPLLPFRTDDWDNLVK